MCVVARREVDAQTPVARATSVGGARRNQDMRARSKSAHRMQAQVAAEGGEKERGKGRGGEGREVGGKGGREGREASEGHCIGIDCPC